jgi:hypothetical protein
MQEKESKTNTHFLLSMLKSGIRISGCIVLYWGMYQYAASLLALAEGVGILEEM